MLLGKPALGVALALSPSHFGGNIGMVGDDKSWLEKHMRWKISLEKRTNFGVYLVYDDLTSFKPMLDNRTTTWIEGYGQIYGVSSAAGGARHGHVMDFL